MKLALLSFFYLILISNSYGQFSRNKEIKIWVTPQITKESLIFGAAEDDSWMENGIGYELGFDYSYCLNDILWIYSGISYLYSSNEYKSFYYSPTNIKFNIIRVPFGIKLKIYNWFMIKGGFSLDYQYNNTKGKYISNQSGLSFALSPCFMLKFLDNLILSAEPKFTHYSIISFNNDKYKDRLMTYGFCIGISKLF